MAMGTCSATLVWRPLHSRHSKLPHLQQVSRRGSLCHGWVPQLRNNKHASRHSRICRCNKIRQQASAGPDISLLRPELQKQWHHVKNQHLGDRRITTSSNLRVWWSCDQCPSGLPHEWLAIVTEYDTVRNGFGPEQVLPTSMKKAFWKDASGQAWEQSPQQRTDPEKHRSKRASVRMSRQHSAGMLYLQTLACLTKVPCLYCGQQASPGTTDGVGAMLLLVPLLRGGFPKQQTENSEKMSRASAAGKLK
ncbi:hypothetical protein WJX77_003759 [Trebouxia sp. C0004]